MLVRAELIRFTLAQCHTTPPLWSIEQAIDLLQYFDSCWALPEGIRQSWIDEHRLKLLADSGIVLTNGGIENSHRWLYDHFFRLQLNRYSTATCSLCQEGGRWTPVGWRLRVSFAPT